MKDKRKRICLKSTKLKKNLKMITSESNEIKGNIQFTYKYCSLVSFFFDKFGKMLLFWTNILIYTYNIHGLVHK